FSDVSFASWTNGVAEAADGTANATTATAATTSSIVSLLIGEPHPCSPEIERPTEGRPSKISGERREKPTAVGRAPSSLASQKACVRPAPPGGRRHLKRPQEVAHPSAAL